MGQQAQPSLIDLIEYIRDQQRQVVDFLLTRWIANCIKQGIDWKAEYKSAVHEAEIEATRFQSLAEAKRAYISPRPHIHCHQHYSVYDKPRGAYL